MEYNDLSNLSDLEINEMYSDIIESGTYLAVECGKGYKGPICVRYINGRCTQYIECY